MICNLQDTSSFAIAGRENVDDLFACDHALYAGEILLYVTREDVVKILVMYRDFVHILTIENICVCQSFHGASRRKKSLVINIRPNMVIVRINWSAKISVVSYRGDHWHGQVK